MVQEKDINVPLAVAIGLILMVFGVTPVKGKTPLQIDYRMDALVGRSYAHTIVSLTCRLDANQPLLEGHFNISVRDEQTLLAQFQSQEFALTPGEQSYSILFPPIQTFHQNSSPIIYTEFDGPNGKIILEPKPFTLPNDLVRSQVIAVCRPSIGSSRFLKPFINRLRLERFNPITRQERQYRNNLRTHTAYLTPDRMPTDPLKYCAYNLAVLDSEGFNKLKGRQLKALEQWIRAGGSACIIPKGKTKKSHLIFLNRLANPTGKDPPFQSNSHGQVVLTHEHRTHKMILTNVGLGRVAFLMEAFDDDEHATSSRWRSTCAFLWKMRFSQMDAIQTEGTWLQKLDESHNQYYYANNKIRPATNMRQLPFQNGAELIRTMLPNTIRLIPTFLVLILLLLFILIIGPLDYFILGFFNLRRLTWVLFPAICILFTFITVRMSSHFLGTKDQAQSMHIYDLEDSGELVRETQLDLIFPSKRRKMERKVSDQLFSKVENFQIQNYGRMNRKNRANDLDITTIKGNMPRQYSFHYQLHQWKPVLFKFLSIPGDLQGKRPHWRLPPRSILDSSYLQVETFSEAFHALNKDFPGEVYVINQRRIFRKDSDQMDIVPRETLLQLCAHPHSGYFSVVSQVSPIGGPTFEDLSLLDTSDPDQWLLVLVTRDGNTIHLHRYIYHKERIWLL